jgi:hypothetical protein
MVNQNSKNQKPAVIADTAGLLLLPDKDLNLDMILKNCYRLSAIQFCLKTLAQKTYPF